MRPIVPLLALVVLATGCDSGRFTLGGEKESPRSGASQDDGLPPLDASERSEDAAERAQRRFDEMKGMESDQERIDAANDMLREQQALADGRADEGGDDLGSGDP